MTESRQRYYAGDSRPDQEMSLRADDGIFVRHSPDLAEKIARLESEIESLRHFIEDRIMDDKGWQGEYNEFCDELNKKEKKP